jgi:hypothetical protein
MANNNTHGQDSPVMNETLSVIDEHITDMNTPRHSFISGERRMTNDSGSEYSSHIDHRMSYITGNETDEEEENEKFTEDEVLAWTPAQTSQHLRSLGIDSRHCDVFEEQEISGEVLLGMDQAAIFMKEFELGVVGRRLRTWHKIKTFQDEVKGPRPTRRMTPSFSGGDSSAESLEPTQNRGATGGTLLPRIPSLMEKQGPTFSFRQSRQVSYPQPQFSPQDQHQIPPPVPPHTQLPSSPSNASPHFSPFGPSGQESPRPSAASIRELSHARRHSSMEASSRPAADAPLAGSPSRGTSVSHQKQGSFDRNWTMTGPPPSFNNRSGSSLVQSLSADRQNFDRADSPIQAASMIDELDRGYFSGGEIDNRRARNVLKKRDSTSLSASHSRQSSVTEEQKRRSNISGRRHSRLASADSVRDSVPNVTSPASKAYYSNAFKGRFRSASARSPGTASPKETPSPTVTNLESDSKGSPATLTSPSPRIDGDPSSDKGASPQLSLQIKSSVSRARRGIGLRAISDAVTGNEKALVASPSSISSPMKESPIQSPTMTGSRTPSAASKSFDLETTDTSSKGTNGVTPPAPPVVSRRSKTKKHTSAYTRGLEKKTPKEQIANCDYSGWMKKKSSNLMTTWKPRLFILRGRRLSYYYSENDKEEKGLIDISSHRVLPADQDIMTSLHATLTGAGASSISPGNAVITTTAATEAAALPNSPNPKSSTDGMFIFKLVPPRTGISRAVNFTKPTVHYFAVDNIKQGRLWMAALMKATIDRDVNRAIEMTNKQKTISLKQARAMNQRPPALMAPDGTVDSVAEGPKSDETGLNIRGLSFDEKLGATSNGNSHKQSISMDVGGSSALPSPPKTAEETAKDSDSGNKQKTRNRSLSQTVSQTVLNTLFNQPDTIAARFA